MNRMKLGEILSVKHGWAFKGEYFAEDGEQSILTPGNFFEKGGFKPNNGKERYYTGTYPKEYLCHKGDLIVAMTQQAEGLLGSTALVPENNKYLHNQRIGLITCDEKRLNKLFAYYLFMTKSVREQLERSSSGTKVKHTSPEKINDVEVEIPDVISQQKIANLLWSIDEKIANNNAINDNLEQQILSIYHYLFTQFDFPDEVGNPYCSSGGKMLQNDILKRNIPITWKVKTLGELCSFQNGINYDKGIIGDKDYRIINVRNISSSSILLDENELDIISLPHKKGDKYCVTDDSIIIARSGIPGATRILFKPTTNTIFCGFIICCTPTDKELQYYLTFYLKLLEGSSATQTGGSILQNVSQDTLSSLPVPIPPKMLLDEFNQTVLQTFELIHTNMNETFQLINLRDWLLPMLMNGQATIND